MELKDKVVVVTGGSKGLGKALAQAFIKEGCKVVISALNKTELEKTATEIGALPVVADVRSVKDTENLLNEAVKKYGGMDVWVNNAGVWLTNQNAELNDLEKVKAMIDINVTGLINGSIVALRHMKTRNEGAILNILSGAATEPKPGIATYSASKWAGRGFTLGIQEELKDTKIKAISICPGGMRTGIFGDYKYADFDSFMDPAKVAAKIVENLKKENPDGEIILRRNNV